MLIKLKLIFLKFNMTSRLSLLQSSSSLMSTNFTNSSKTETYDEVCNLEGEAMNIESRNSPKDYKEDKCISTGDFLPYGPRLFYETHDNVVRMRDIGEKNRILVLGVIGSFTPDCWNRHLFLVLNKLKYYEEREVDYICCIATNDAYTQKAWGAYLGCDETVLMWADTTKRFTKAIGMEIIIPWLDNNVRSKRYVLLAEDMQVSKIIVAPNDDLEAKWQCEHIICEESDDDEEEDY